jgi:co-chaperonin GroES (HSP10)
MKIQPHSDTLLLEKYEYIPLETSKIYLHTDDNATSVDAFNKVLDCNEDNEEGIKPGDIVLVDKNTGFFFNIDGHEYRLVLYKQILAKVTNIEKEQEKRRIKLEEKESD